MRINKRPKGAMPIHQNEFQAVMVLAIHMLPDMGDDLTAAWGAACVRYTGAIKLAAGDPSGISVPARGGNSPCTVHVDEEGYFVLMREE